MIRCCWLRRNAWPRVRASLLRDAGSSCPSIPAAQSSSASRRLVITPHSTPVLWGAGIQFESRKSTTRCGSPGWRIVVLPCSSFPTMTRSVRGSVRLKATLLLSRMSVSNWMPSATLLRFSSSSAWWTLNQPSSGNMTVSGCHNSESLLGFLIHFFAAYYARNLLEKMENRDINFHAL
ncbi:hypothetical protein EMIT0P265_40337 [Pseudomonas zeae]